MGRVITYGGQAAIAAWLNLHPDNHPNNLEHHMAEQTPLPPEPPVLDAKAYDQCPNTGLKILKSTRLVPVYMVKPIPELGFMAGEVRGVLPANAAVMIKGGYGYVHGEGPKAPAKAAKDDGKATA